MMRVALATFESFYDHSLALDYLVSFARVREGTTGRVEFKVFIHREQEDADETLRRLVQWQPDLVGFNTYVWNIQRSIKAARNLKRSLPQAVVVFGGMEATFNVLGLLKEVKNVDFIVVGEGELTFVELLGRLNRSELFGEMVPGLAWRDKSGTPVSGGIGPTLTQMDDLPSPFLSPDFAERGLRRILYESYRGCAFRCDFCLYSREYAPKRYFSLERVKADLDVIVAAKATHLRFVDATFNLDRKRAKAILRHLEGCETDVSVEVSAEFFDEEMVSLLAPAGIRHVDIGLQSTQRDVLKAINREWYREERFKRNLGLLRDEPALTLNVELIAGLPEDSPLGLRRSLDEAIVCWPDHVSVYRLLGLKGTQLAAHSEKLGLRFAPDPPYELIESGSFSRSQLDQLNDLTFAHLILFNLGTARYAFRYLVDQFGLRPCDVYDDFLSITGKLGDYAQEQVRILGQYHAYGNRFDKPMPAGLELWRVRQAATQYFQHLTIVQLSDVNRRIILDLVDVGFCLARLDTAREDARKVANSHSRVLRFAPWCERRVLHPLVVKELVRQGHDLGGMTSEDVASVVFFFHPELGPALLALDALASKFLEQFQDTNRTESEVDVEPFRTLAILVDGDDTTEGAWAKLGHSPTTRCVF